MTYQLNDESFLKDVARHEVLVLRDNGVDRHIRFKRPGTICMHFDLITWPGHLCYTGDMGTFVFQRLDDMFQFFRRGDGERKYAIDMRYWAEKCLAADRADGIKEFSKEAFQSDVKEYFEQATEDWDEAKKRSVWREIEYDVLSRVDDGLYAARQALHDFDAEGFEFRDWERDSMVFTHRFTWCCYALAWGIQQYDAIKTPAKVAA